MRNLRAIHFGVVLALILALTPATLAADNAAVVGKWTLSITFADRPVEIVLMIEEAAGGGLTGTWISPRGKDTLSDVKWDSQELTFSRKMERDGQQVEVKHSAKVQGDTLTGKMVRPQGEIPFTGKRSS